MSNRINKIFAAVARPLIVSEVCGAPNLEVSLQRISSIIDNNADIVNLIIPFSDPMADGAVIQQAAQQALANGSDLQKILQMVKKIRQSYPDTGLIVSGYSNVFLQYTWEKLFAELSALEIDGICISDMPFEERSEIAEFEQKYNISAIVDTGLTEDEARLRKITADAKVMVFCANADKIDFLRQISPVPVASGIASTGNAALAPLDNILLPVDELAEFVQKCKKSAAE